FQQLQESGAIDKDAMQSNSIHDLLVQSFNDFSPEPGIIHFAAPGDDPEDLDTLKYLQSCAVSAKRKTKILKIKDLGYNEAGWLF
ncbi:glutathionylspermidine synthase family protein, partial [Acinetobacter baumannii]